MYATSHFTDSSWTATKGRIPIVQPLEFVCTGVQDFFTLLPVILYWQTDYTAVKSLLAALSWAVTYQSPRIHFAELL